MTKFENYFPVDRLTDKRSPCPLFPGTVHCVVSVAIVHNHRYTHQAITHVHERNANISWYYLSLNSTLVSLDYHSHLVHRPTDSDTVRLTSIRPTVHHYTPHTPTDPSCPEKAPEATNHGVKKTATTAPCATLGWETIVNPSPSTRMARSIARRSRRI